MKRIWVFMKIARYFPPMWHTFGFSQQIFLKVLHIKSQRNSFSGGRGDACE